MREPRRRNVFTVDVHVKSLAIFDALVREHTDEPERIKSAITRFVDYVVWHAGEMWSGSSTAPATTSAARRSKRSR